MLNHRIIDTARGGNAIATGSPLFPAAIDSMSRVFTHYLPAAIVRFGNPRPRIRFDPGEKKGFI